MWQPCFWTWKLTLGLLPPIIRWFRSNMVVALWESNSEGVSSPITIGPPGPIIMEIFGPPRDEMSPPPPSNLVILCQADQ